MILLCYGHCKNTYTAQKSLSQKVDEEGGES